MISLGLYGLEKAFQLIETAPVKDIKSTGSKSPQARDERLEQIQFNLGHTSPGVRVSAALALGDYLREPFLGRTLSILMYSLRLEEDTTVRKALVESVIRGGYNVLQTIIQLNHELYAEFKVTSNSEAKSSLEKKLQSTVDAIVSIITTTKSTADKPIRNLTG